MARSKKEAAQLAAKLLLEDLMEGKPLEPPTNAGKRP